MQIVKTVIWVLLLVALLLFSMANWDPTVTVRIWDGIVVDTKIPAIVIVSFLIGFVPMWLFYRGSKWRLTRKVASLENAARTAAVTPVAHGGAHDADRDGIPDRADPHPLTPDGTVAAPTRTDRDGDGVPDGDDACPDEFGTGRDGCPIPDRDGDGVPDADRLGELPLEGFNLRTAREPVGAEHGLDGGEVGGVEGLAAVGDHGSVASVSG